MRPTSALCPLMIAVVAGSSVAQVLVPPTKPAPKEEYVAPPLPERPQPTQAQRRPARPQQVDPKSLPDLPTASLTRPLGAPEDYEGPLPRYTVNTHYLALERNPTISDEDRTKIAEVLAQRTRRFETTIIENLEVVLDVDAGLIGEMTVADMEAMKGIVERIQPIQLTPDLSQQLREGGALTPTQEGYNRKIIGEYNEAYNEEVKASDQSNALDELFRYVMQDSAREALMVLDMMLYEATTRMDAVLASAGIEGEGALARATGEPTDDLDERVRRVTRVKLSWRGLELEEKRRLLQAVVDTRPDGESPTVPFDVTHEGKIVSSPDADPEGE
ncbi:MAG: hypothetical protein AAFR38_11250 [Planctomycetota bacterium]